MGKVSDSELREVGENPREIYNSGNGDYTSKNTELISFRNEREVLDFKDYNSGLRGIVNFPSSKSIVSREEIYEMESTHKLGEMPIEEEIQEGLVIEEDMIRDEEYRSIIEEDIIEEREENYESSL